MTVKGNENKRKYGIRAVTYDEDRKYIKKVEISLMRGDNLENPPKTWFRKELMQALKDLNEVVTVIKTDQKIKTTKVRIDDFYKGDKFIRSVSHTALSDDLGDLPYITDIKKEEFLIVFEDKGYKTIEDLIEVVKNKAIYSVELPEHMKNRLIKLVPKDSKYNQSFEEYLKNISKDFTNTLKDNVNNVSFYQVQDIYYMAYETQILIPEDGIPENTDLRLFRLSDLDHIYKLTDLINENLEQKKIEKK